MNRILYIYYIPHLDTSKGVYTKLISQLNSAKNLNIKFLLLTCENKKKLKNENLFIENVSKHKVTRLKEVASALEKYAKYFNVFVIRKFVYNPFILKSIRKIKKIYGIVIITDHQTKEIPEYIAKREYTKVVFESFGILYVRQFNLVDGVIGVTKEIADYEKRIYNVSKSFVIGNGICFDKSLYTGFQPFDGRRLIFIMSVGDYYPWHGIERLLKSIDRYRNYLNIKVNILLGTNSDMVNDLVRGKKYVNLFISPNEAEVKDVFKNSNLAVSSLAIYRNRLMEAAPLKSREYVLRGIPFVYGYYDPDITNSEVDRYLFRVSNDGSIINLKEITTWLENISENAFEISDKLVKFGRDKLSWYKKLKSLVNFITARLVNGKFD